MVGDNNNEGQLLLCKVQGEGKLNEMKQPPNQAKLLDE